MKNQKRKLIVSTAAVCLISSQFAGAVPVFSEENMEAVVSDTSVDQVVSTTESSEEPVESVDSLEEEPLSTDIVVPVQPDIVEPVLEETIEPTFEESQIIVDSAISTEAAESIGETDMSLPGIKTAVTAVSASSIIPDPQLAAVIRTKLGLSAEAAITTDNIKNLKTLSVSTSGEINSLEGLQYATNLETLKLEYQNISNIEPLRNLTNLATLSLAYNAGISNVSAISNLRSLTSLTLDSTSINDTELQKLSGLTQLTGLSVSFNPGITNLNVTANMPNLKWLTAIGCSISDISSLKNNTQLYMVYLAENLIEDVSPLTASAANLWTLTLNKNRIKDVTPFLTTSFTKLKKAEMGGQIISASEVQTAGNEYTEAIEFVVPADIENVLLSKISSDLLSFSFSNDKQTVTFQTKDTVEKTYDTGYKISYKTDLIGYSADVKRMITFFAAEETEESSSSSESSESTTEESSTSTSETESTEETTDSTTTDTSTSTSSSMSETETSTTTTDSTNTTSETSSTDSSSSDSQLETVDSSVTDIESADSTSQTTESSTQTGNKNTTVSIATSESDNKDKKNLPQTNSKINVGMVIAGIVLLISSGYIFVKSKFQVSK